VQLPIAAAEVDQPRFADAAVLHGSYGGQAGQGKIAVPARQFGKSGHRACLDFREFHRDDQLVRPQVSLEQSFEEVLGFHTALALGTGQQQRGAERHRAGRKFGRRIGVGETAAERAAVPDR
jgi:hypothetical protein